MMFVRNIALLIIVCILVTLSNGVATASSKGMTGAAYAGTQYTITATAGTHGTISPGGAVSVDSGTTQSFTITPDTGYFISTLFVDTVSVSPTSSYTFTNVVDNHSITASFAINQYTITATSGANGSISPSGSTVLNYGSNQTYTITPNTGYHVDSLIVDGTNQGQVTSYAFNNISTNHTIRSVFAINQYTITATSGANGSISPSGSVIVNYGSNQTFTITPNTGYHIDSTIVDGVNQGALASYTFNSVTANHTIRSVFAIDQFTITATTGSNGSISPSGTVTVNYGSNQTFTITPNTGYHVDSLIVDGTNQGQLSSYTFTSVVANHTIRSVFAINQYTITASSGANGSISPSGSVVVNYGSNQSFTITANTGYHIDSVLVDGVNQGTVSSYTFNSVTANHTIRSVFAINQYTITATSGANGSISPSGSVIVNHGSNQSFTITANTGYHIDSVIVDGANQGAVASYTFNNVIASHTIRSVFAINQYTITSTSGANGSISPSGSVIVNHGSNQSFTLTSNTGYHVDSLIADGVNQGALASYTFNNVIASHTIRAVFAIDQFTITATSGANGSISPSGSVIVNYGSNQTFTITPNTGYHVDSTIVDGVNQGTVASYTFNSVTANHTIRSVFAIDQFTITATSGVNGSISPSGSVIVNYGSNQTFTITPNTGYHVDSTIVDGVNQGAVASYTFNSVTANHTIRSVFAIDQFTITATSGANGSISPSGSVIVNYGSNQTFTITPATGYHIDSVLVDGVNQGTVASYTFNTVTANHSIRSVFAINQYTITASTGANGSISPSGSVIVNYGSNQSFTITANTGYHVDSVLVDGVDQGGVSSYTFTAVTTNHTIRSVFAINQYTITATSDANGSLSPSGSVVVNHGSNQSFTITSNTGYHIDSVLVDGVNQGAISSYTFNTVTTNHTIRSVFAINQYTITATAGANGSLSPSGAVTVNYGSNQSFTITPTTGYHVDSVLVDGAFAGAVTSYTFNTVISNHTISATFAVNQFTIAATAGANGSIAPSGSVNANFGTNQTFTITPNTGYHVDSTIVDGVNQGAVASYTFNNVTANHTIRSVFAIDQFTMTASSGANGSISPSGSIIVNYGSNQTFTITPSTGYHVDSVIVDGTNQGQVASYTLNNIITNHTIRAVFAIDQFTITATSGANGSISPSGSVIVNYGSNQIFTITPNTGYHVDSTIVDGVNQGAVASYTFNAVIANHTLRAVFAINQYTLTASSGANGTISPSGSLVINYGSNQSFTFTPDTGYHIDSIIVDGSNQGQVASYTFNNVIANHTIRAVFAIDQFTITASSGANGSVSPNGSVIVNYGSNQTFTITPTTGYHIDSMIVDGVDQGAVASYTFNTVTTNHTLRAVFAINQYTITASAGANGTITPNGSTVVNYGSNQSYTITPATGYHIDSLIVDGIFQGTLVSYPFNNVTANHSIRAVFAIDRFTITATSGVNGSISPSGSVIIDYGANQTFTITPGTGYHVDSVLVDGANQGQITSYPFTAVTSNHTIRAVFAIDQFTITASAGTNGSISPSGTTVANYGSNQTYTITPTTGYHVDSLIVDGVLVGSATTYTFTNVIANHTIQVTFAIDQLTITATAGANGSISPSGSVNITYGANQTFTITPNVGYHIGNVIVDGAFVGSGSSYTFTNVIGNHTISATFAVDQFTITASAGANGSISPSGSITVNYGSNQTFTITPGGGYHVDNLIVDGAFVGSATSYTFTGITTSHTISATFAINQFTITATAGANGSISPSGSVNADFGASQSFTITPNPGYHVDNLIVDGAFVTPAPNYTFINISANHSIIVTFAVNQYTITATAGVNGSISPSGAVNVNSGADQGFTITPNAGYHVDNLIVDGVFIGSATSYAFINVTANHTINATFIINQYTITSSAGTNGTISPSGAVTVNYGSSQSFTITPNTGYFISNLFVDTLAVNPTSSYTFTNVSANHMISATFGLSQFTIIATSGPNGSISPSGAVNVNFGTNYTFLVTPNIGYHVDSLIVDGVNQGAVTSYTFNGISANHIIRSVFAINQYTITAAAGANGNISPSGTLTANYGSSQTFTITPNTGYYISSLFVDTSSITPTGSYSFNNITGNHTITATFAILQYTITATAGANGTISPSGTVTANYGSNQSFTILPTTGYHVDSIIVDGIYQSASGSYTFINVTANHTIRSVYAINQFTITASTGPNGTIAPSGLVSVNYSSNQTFTFTPTLGYHIDSVIVDGINQGALPSFTFNNVTTNHTIRSVFAINKYIITATSGANGSISPSGSVSVNYGSDQTFTFTPNTGYHIDSVIVDGVVYTPAPSYTFSNVIAIHSIRVTFAINQYTIVASSGANGNITPVGSVIVNYGTNQTFTVTPNTGYHIDSVFVDSVNQGAIAGYTFNIVTAAHTIRAVFAINRYTIVASAGANGSISPSGNVIVTYGSNQTFAFTPTSGYRVDSVFVDTAFVGTGIASYVLANVTANHTIRVQFILNRHTLTATAGPNGTITPSGAVIVVHNSNQTFTIAPNTGYHIDSVLVDGVNQGALASYTFKIIQANHTIDARFSINQYSIMASTGFNGTISPFGTLHINYGGSRTYTMIPNPGYHVADVIVDGASVGPVNSYTFTNIRSNHTIAVLFSFNTYTIMATAGANGTINPSGAVTVTLGTDQLFTMTASSGYIVDSVFVDSVLVGAPRTYKFTNISANHTINCTFGPIPISAVQYRSFTYDSLHTRRGVKKEPMTTYWEFKIKNDQQTAITEINIQFQIEVKEIVSASGLTPSGIRKDWTFAGTIAPNDTVVIKGRSAIAGAQVIRKLWLGPIVGTPILNRFPRYQRPELPMPNIANVRDDAFARGAFVPTSGLIVGVPRPDSPLFYGWVRLEKSTDMYRSTDDFTGYHSGTPRGFDVFWNGNPFTREQKHLLPFKHNNRLFGDLLALKFNIAISSLQITQAGFGELRYMEIGSPFDSMLVREIAAKADSMMTFYRNDPAYYQQLDSTIMNINRAFSGPIDTTSWSDTLKIKGTKPLAEVSYLTKTDIVPAIITPLTVEIPQNIPTAFELYQNYPNPFNPTTTIEFNLSVSSVVTLKVYNMVGQEVATLLDNQQLDDGPQEVEFNASNLSSGVYFYRVISRGLQGEGDTGGASSFSSITKKMVLVK